MFDRIKKFLAGEEGYTAESLVWTAVVGMGAATIAFGLYAADRFQAGGIGDDLKAIMTPSALPVADEQISEVQAGYTGAVVGITVE